MGMFSRLFGRKPAASESEVVDLTESAQKVMGPDGGRILMSVGPKRKELSKPTSDEITFAVIKDGQSTYDCGHQGPKLFELVIWGLQGELKPMAPGKWKMCPQCTVEDLKKVVIHCALCGHPIFPGQAVALYGDEGKFNPAWVTKTEKGAVVGCLGWDCCPGSIFFAGHWDGKQVRMSAMSGAAIAAEAMKTDKVVVANLD